MRALPLLALLLRASATIEEEECEACGLLMWKLQTIVAGKTLELKELKAAKEKRSKKSTKAHSKRWIMQEYKNELSAAVEAKVEVLAADYTMSSSACRYESPIDGSALRAAGQRGPFLMEPCRQRVATRCSAVLEDQQDELVGAALKGRGASACAALLDGCSAPRAALLLGSHYAEDLSHTKLDRLQVGYSDAWTLHTDVDGSVYWFMRSSMESRKEPPPGWRKDTESGEWAIGTPQELAEDLALAAHPPSVAGEDPPSRADAAKEEL